MSSAPIAHRRFRHFIATLGIAASAAAPAAAQADYGSVNSATMTRHELENLLEQARTLSSSPSVADEARRLFRQEASMIEIRLSEGDFREGDLVVVEVQGEPVWSDTFAVHPGPVLSLPELTQIPLNGVLRSELDDYLVREIGRFVQNPRVRAKPLIRLGVLGQVSEPGFFHVPADADLGNVIMTAGGPTQTADVNRLRIERSGDVVWEGDGLREALHAGATVDQMNLLAGDIIMLPERREPWFSVGLLQTILITVPSIILLFTL